MAKLAISGGKKAAEGLVKKIPLWSQASRKDKEAILGIIESSQWSCLHPSSRVEGFE